MQKKDNDDKKTLKKMWKIYIYGVCGTLITMHLINLYKNRNNIYHNNKLKISYEESKELADELSLKVGESVTNKDNALVISAVFENENLTEEEKEYIYNLVDLLNENPYLNKSYAYENLRELDIIYEKNPDKEYRKNVIGTYDEEDNVITILDGKNKDDTFYHELIHCVYGDDYLVKLPVFFNEGMTEILTNEYFSENPFLEELSYPYETTMIKVLCELIGSDKLLEAYSNEDIKIVRDALKEKLGAENANDLMDSMDRISLSLQKEKKANSNDVNITTSILTNYYENNVDKESKEYEINTYYISLLKTLKGSHPYTSYRFFLNATGYFVKAYFSEKLKEKYPEPFHAYYLEHITGKSNKVYKKTYNIVENDSAQI